MKTQTPESILKQAGLKVTAQRCLILKLLQSQHPGHLSADGIYKHLSKHNDVSIATIYRVLLQFEEANIIVKHNFSDDHSIYELNTGAHHDHILCTQCGQVQEFVDNAIEARQQAIAKHFEFKMTDHNLTIYGLCKTCASL